LGYAIIDFQAVYHVMNKGQLTAGSESIGSVVIRSIRQRRPIDLAFNVMVYVLVSLLLSYNLIQYRIAYSVYNIFNEKNMHFSLEKFGINLSKIKTFY